jgi:hypothetical protein
MIRFLSYCDLNAVRLDVGKAYKYVNYLGSHERYLTLLKTHESRVTRIDRRAYLSPHDSTISTNFTISFQLKIVGTNSQPPKLYSGEFFNKLPY